MKIVTVNIILHFILVEQANTECIVEKLLGKITKVEHFMKYRRLTRQNSKDKDIILSMEKSKAIIQTKVSMKSGR